MKKVLNYKRHILQLLEGSEQPLDVEKIRVGCDIGNWNTALKHCLELQYEGKIQGTKTSKGWIFWIESSNKESSGPPSSGLEFSQEGAASNAG